MMFDYVYFANEVFEALDVPVRVYKNHEKILHLQSIDFTPDIADFYNDRLLETDKTVIFFTTENFLYFFTLKPINTKYTFIIGPTFVSRPDKLLRENILKSIGEPRNRNTELQSYLSSINNYKPKNLLHIICTINYTINNNKLDMNDLLMGNSTSIDELYEEPPQLEESILTDKVKPNRTLVYRNLIYSYVEHGQVIKMKEHLSTPIPDSDAVLAETPLRQHKNLFIITTTFCGDAAIKGGLDNDIAFAMTESYIHKVELLDSFNSIQELFYQMILDYTKRVEKCLCHGVNNNFTNSIRNYILSNIENKITIGEISTAIGVSRAHMCVKFKKLTGISISQFINEQKIEEAKHLLTTTNRSINYISNSLEFSTQSYFQNVFKKITGKTVKQYREENR